MALHEYQKQMYKKVGVILALILLPIAGFFAGMQYQKQTGAPIENGRTAKFGGPRGVNFRNRVIGTVKSISDTNITVTSRIDESDKTYTLTSSTTYKNGSASAQFSDVKTGDTVMLVLDSSDTTKVMTVALNPASFRSTEDAAPTTSTSDGEAMLQ